MVSVLIPTYNRINSLLKVLPSYLIQENVEEVLILDDCSTDSTEETIQKIARTKKKIKYHKNKVNLGAPATRNKGFTLAKGDYVYMGEDDLKLKDDVIRVLLNHVQANQVIAVRRIWMQINESEEESLRRANQIKGNQFNKRLLTTNCEIDTKEDLFTPLIDASMLIPRSIFESIKYDEHYRNNSWREETDYQLSCLKQNINLVHCSHSHTFHLFKPGDMGGNHSKSLLIYEYQIWQNNLYMWNKHKSYLTGKMGISTLFLVHFTIYRMKKVLFEKLLSFKRNILK